MCVMFVVRSGGEKRVWQGRLTHTPSRQELLRHGSAFPTELEYGRTVSVSSDRCERGAPQNDHGDSKEPEKSKQHLTSNVLVMCN